MLCPSISRKDDPREAQEFRSRVRNQSSLLWKSPCWAYQQKICLVYNNVIYICLLQDGQSVEEANLQLQVYRDRKVKGLWHVHFMSVLL